VKGDDPGNLGGGEEAEAILDMTWSLATAPNAFVNLVVQASTNTTDGVDLSELEIVDSNLADIMTESFGSCEAAYTSADAAGISSLAQQAAAQGITYFVATGDSGAEGCDNPNAEQTASGPVSVNVLASTPYNVAVGGTIFNEGSQSSKYWSSATPLAETALSYIPENVWNESCASSQCGSGANIAAGGGGASTFFSKPSWQSGVVGIPADGKRDIPDVSLTAAFHDPYLICYEFSCREGFIYFISGTSASTPSFAGIMALVDQKLGGRQGQANYVLYRLAAGEVLSKCNGSNTSGMPASNCIFNDITAGNNAVPGESGYGTSSAKYQAGTGYDLATGLGSVNVNNLVNSWSMATFKGTATTLDLNPKTFTHGSSVAVNMTVTSADGTPTGNVSLHNTADLDFGGVFFTLSNGSVSSTTKDLPGGTYGVVAYYAGDGTFAPSESQPVSVTISAEQSKTALSIFGFDNVGNIMPYTNQPYGTPTYLRADVTSNSGHGIASGNVTFTENGLNLLPHSYILDSQGTAATARGVFTIPAGAHSIVASYFGDSSFKASNSAPVNITVTQASTSIGVTPSSTNVADGNYATLTAKISTNSDGNGPTGQVQFYSNGTAIGAAAGVAPSDGTGNIQTGTFTVSSGAAVLVTTLPIGQNTITATYSGDQNYAGSTSEGVTVNVAADFDFNAASTSLTVTRGVPGSLTLTIAGHTGYNSTISFSAASCRGLPAEASCAFSPSSVTGNGSTTLTISAKQPTIASPATVATWLLTSTFGFGLVLLVSRNRRSIAVLAAIVFIAFGANVACGGGGGGSSHDPGTPVGTYPVIITASSGVISHTVNLTLQVH
jgi:hypothetical protein